MSATLPKPSVPTVERVRDLASLPKAILDATLSPFGAGIRPAAEALLRNAAREGVVWVEARWSPRPDPRSDGPSDRQSLATVLDSLTRAGCRHAVGTGLVVESGPAPSARELAASAVLAASHAAEGVVAFGLDLAPDQPLGPVLDAVAEIREAGLGLVVGPILAHPSMSAVLASLAPERMRAGTALADGTVAILSAAGPCIDLRIPNADEDRPQGALSSVDGGGAGLLRRLRALGVRCSLSGPTGPERSGLGAVAAYDEVRQVLDLDDEDLATLARDALEASWAPEPLKARAGAAIDAWLAPIAAGRDRPDRLAGTGPR